jgi:surfeit locus 1 family protein
VTGAAGSGNAQSDHHLTQEEHAPKWRFVLLILFCVFGIGVFTALGIWQVERRTWKLALIDRVESRVHASPVAPPGPAQWPSVTRADDEYRAVRVTGRFANDRETLVEASTALGMGFWVLTPFETRDGFTVLINRGFVPRDRRDPATREAGQIAGETTVTGLLRMTEPKGAFLRTNDPAVERWYSRDVGAIAKARGLVNIAPYFIDAGPAPNPGGLPVGGLTVVSFYNNHLVYAVTWFALAVMLAAALFRVVLERYRHG